MARMLEALKQAGKPILRIAEIPPPPVRGLRALPAELPAPLPASPSPLPPAPKERIEDRRSKIEDRGSRIAGLSSILNPQSSILSSAPGERGRGEGEEAISYIEVGGRGEPIDASPDVLACPSAPGASPTAATPARIEDRGSRIEDRQDAAKDRHVQTSTGDPPSSILHPPASMPVPTTTTIKFRPLQAEIVALAPGPARFAPELVAFHRPHDPAVEQYTKLLAILESQLPTGPKRALYFTAAAPGAGTTTTSLNLAIVLARRGTARVVVIDANQRHPAVAERLGLRAVPGLAEVLAGGVALHQVLQETAQPNLHVVTAGRTRPVAGLRLAGGSFVALLQQLRERYDWLLIDAANWDGSPETVAIGSACDAVYLVLRAAEEETADVANLLRAIPQQGSRLQGCIVTQTI